MVQMKHSGNLELRGKISVDPVKSIRFKNMFVVTEVKPVAGIYNDGLKRFDFSDRKFIFAEIGRRKHSRHGGAELECFYMKRNARISSKGGVVIQNVAQRKVIIHRLEFTHVNGIPRTTTGNAEPYKSVFG